MTMSTITAIIVAATPAITAIIGIIAAVIKLINSGKATNQEVIDKFEETRKAVMDTKEYESLKAELALAHAENREIKKKMNELLTKIDRVAREEAKEEE